MSSTPAAHRGALAGLTALAAALLVFLSFGAPSTSAASTTTGTAKFTVGAGKAGKSLVRAGVKVNAVGPARVTRNGKRFVVKLPVRDLKVGKGSDAGLKGGFVLRKGKHAVRVRNLNIAVLKSGKVGIGGSIQKIRPRKSKATFVNIFNVAGKAKARTEGVKTTASLRNGKVRFTAAVLNKVRRQLGLKRAPRGQVAVLNVNAVRTDDPVDPCEVDPNADGCPIVDPYLEQCGVEATAKQTGSITPAGPLPEFTPTPGTSGPASLTWGFKDSFRTYVASIASGSIHALDGAATTGSAPVFSGFEFPTEGFRYSHNGTPWYPADDKAVLEGSGTALFCATGHGFRVALSNPTLVINGENSRIDADVDANLSGTWIPAQRITVAKLDVTNAATLAEDGDGIAINWTNVPASLTAEGSQAFCGIGELDNCSQIYPKDKPLDPVDLTVSIDAVFDQYKTECGSVATSTVDNARTPASALPDMTGALATTSPMDINWGFRATFRGYVFGVNPASGLQALDGAAREATPPPDPTRGFLFPVSDGKYLANDEGDTTDDQAVINGTGTALFCNSPHGFWVSISNPTIVIDGENSRIIADIASNESGVWKTTQRVDFADLDLSGITPTYDGSEVSWGSVPAKLSSAAGPFGNVTAGTPLDPVTVAVATDQDD